MRVGKNKIKTGGGKILKFKSAKKLKRWERVAQAIKHGFKPKQRRKTK